MTDVIVLVGAGSIGQAIARRVGAGKHVLLKGVDFVDRGNSLRSYPLSNTRLGTFTRVGTAPIC